MFNDLPVALKKSALSVLDTITAPDLDKVIAMTDVSQTLLQVAMLFTVSDCF